MIPIAVAASVLIAGSFQNRCVGLPTNHERLQWSRPATIVSPHRRWQIEVHPILASSENQTPVSIVDCRTGDSRPLFSLERSGELYWGADDRMLLVVNESTADMYELLTFNTAAQFAGKPNEAMDKLDSLVKRELSRRVGSSRQVEFYLPSVVSWVGTSAVLAVGGETSSGHDGPMTAYCFGVIVDTPRPRIIRTVSARELKLKFNAACRVSP